MSVDDSKYKLKALPPITPSERFTAAFVSVFYLAGISVLVTTISTDKFSPFIFIWSAMFIGIPTIFIYKPLSRIMQYRKLLKTADVIEAKVFDYQIDNTVLVNGQPVKDIVIRYFDNRHELQQAVLDMDITDASAFPIGATVYVLKDGYTYVPASGALDIKLRDEDILMDYDYDPINRRMSQGVQCPMCGGLCDVPLGGAARCTYCGAKLTLNNDGALIKIEPAIK